MYGDDNFGLYANSREEYWSEINERLRTYKLKDLVLFIEVWNITSNSWNKMYDAVEDNTIHFQ